MCGIEIMGNEFKLVLIRWILIDFQLGAAVAVPLDNGLFNVFMSYCIAGGFGQLEYDSPDGIDPPPFQTV